MRASEHLAEKAHTPSLVKRLTCRIRGHRPSTHLGCIDPHGMWPFAPDRERCAKCRAIRSRCRRCGVYPPAGTEADQ